MGFLPDSNRHKLRINYSMIKSSPYPLYIVRFKIEGGGGHRPFTEKLHLKIAIKNRGGGGSEDLFLIN